MSSQPRTVAVSADVSVRGMGFDAARLERVREAVRADIAAGRCHGVAMRVARRGQAALVQ